MQRTLSIIRIPLIITLLFLCVGLVAPLGTQAADTQPARQGTTAAKGAVEQREIDVLTRIGATIGNMVLSVASMVTYAGGALLEKSITDLIIGMGTAITTNSIGGSINSLWTMIRDICNLAFIFGFIYIGIRTIIDADSSNAKRVLAHIVMGALLINFSLFIVKFVIDASNYLAVEIYKSLGGGTGGISLKFAELMRISTWYAPVDGTILANITTGGSFAYYLMGAILLMVAGFVFAAGGILILIRFVALILIMIFSPVLFAATVFPGTAQYANMLWSKLFSYAFFAPVYLLLLLISIKVLEGTVAVFAGTRKLTDAFSGNGTGASMSTDAYGVVLSFLMAIFFLIMSLQIAQKLGIAGADKAISVGKDLRNRGQRMMGGATFGAGAALGRTTIGRLGNKISDSDKLKDHASKSGLTGWAARQTLRGSRVAADSSFDARKIGGVGDKLGIGEGAKGGYQTQLKETKKKEEEFARSLGEVDDDDVQVMARKKEWERATSDANANLPALKNQLQNAPPAARAGIQQQIDVLEKAQKETQLAYEKEKQRRIIGSTHATPLPENAREVNILKGPAQVQGSVAEAKRDLDNAWTNYHNLNDAQKTAARPGIQNLMNELAKRKDRLAEISRGKDGGYAGVLEKEKWYSSWPTGRSTWDNRKAGKEMRKNAEKGLPKKKDD